MNIHKTIALCTLLQACASLDIANGSELRPNVDRDGFEFRSFSDIAYDENDPAAEAIRIAELEDRLSLNQLCPAGYIVTDRQVVVQSAGVITGAQVSDIYYTGRCR